METSNLALNIPWENLSMFLPMVVIAITGYYFKKNPPKKINRMVGYRTKASMKSQDAWDFAQVYSSSLLFNWSLAGIVGMALQLYTQKSMNPTSFAITSICLLLAIVAGVFYFTERELKSNFEEK